MTAELTGALATRKTDSLTAVASRMGPARFTAQGSEASPVTVSINAVCTYLSWPITEVRIEADKPLWPTNRRHNPGVLPASRRKIDYQRLLTDHPGIVDNLVGVSPGLISGLGSPLVFVGDVPGAAHLIALSYPDGRPMVADAGVDTSSASMRNPPRGFGDLMDGLDYRNGKSHPGGPDQIDVRVITHADGSKAYIVDIPGTKVWDRVRAGGLGHADRDPFGSSIFEYLEVILTARRTQFDAMRAAQT
jgi:hypothetical protein